MAVAYYPAMTFADVMCADVWEMPPCGVECVVVAFFPATTRHRWVFVVPLVYVDGDFEDTLRRADLADLRPSNWGPAMAAAKLVFARLRGMVGAGRALRIDDCEPERAVPPGHVVRRVVTCAI